MFRFPKDYPVENFQFYQRAYKEKTVTNLPTETALSHHIENNFSDVSRNIAPHLKLIREYSSGPKLLDFGASWGYCTYQFDKAGFEATGFDISRSRTAYGHKHLHVEMVTNTASLPDHSFDVIYAAHVLEHMPNPKETLKELRRLLVPGGAVFIFVPNGAGEPARRLGVGWPPLINEKHVMAYTPEFFRHSMQAAGFRTLFASSPYDEPPRSDANAGQFDGEELLVIGYA